MLAGSRAHKAAPPPTGEPSEGPSVDELAAPDSHLESASAADLLTVVQRSQETRVMLNERFDEIFEFYVTAGRAAEYQGLCDRFSAKFGALTSNLERSADRLEKAGHAPLATLVRGIVTDEATRLAKQLETQVLRQRLSLADESPDKPELQQRVREAAASTAKATASIYEALEELRAEAADLEEE